MEASQYILDFPVLQSSSMEDFVVGECNRLAADFISAWPNWPSHALVLAGPRASGKTHLANVWQKRARAALIAAGDLSIEEVPNLGRAVIVEDAHATRDWQALLHLYNWLKDNQGHLLMTAERSPGNWPLDLKDLSSRLKSVPCVGLENPGEDILAAVMMKQFSDRQIVVEDAVISYLLKRMERSFESVREIVRRIDRLALEKQARVTVPLAKQALDLK